MGWTLRNSLVDDYGDDIDEDDDEADKDDDGGDYPQQVFAEALRGVDIEQNFLEPNFSGTASAHKECTVSGGMVMGMMMV